MEAEVSNTSTTVQDSVLNDLNVAQLLGRLRRGIPQVLGLALLGCVIAIVLAMLASRAEPVSTTTRVAFSFPGFEQGKYPDKSKFQPDDLRSPSVVLEALRQLNLNTSSESQSEIRGAIGIEGLIPPNIVRERDRLRAAGQMPAAYVPDEYLISLTLPRGQGLSIKQRERLLNELVNAYREMFYRTYTRLPEAFGSVFETLRTADFPEYELIFNSEMGRLRFYLYEQQETAKSYRSPTTNLSFKDLAEQADLFTQIQLSEVLGLIHENGLSRNRPAAMTKMDYYLGQLNQRQSQAEEEERVVTGLLQQTQTRSQNYILGIKSQAAQARSESTVVDQGLIDSLLANDAYNFLLRRALDAGLDVKKIQAELARLVNLRDNMKSFVQSTATDQSVAIQKTEAALKNLEANYNKLIQNVRLTEVDFARQQYADAIRSSQNIQTTSLVTVVSISAFTGLVLGCLFGLGLSLLGIYISKSSTLS